MHANSLMLFERFGLRYFSGNQKVLEIGPDVYPSSFRKKFSGEITWDTLELKGVATERTPTIEATDPYSYPIKDGSYDIVVSGNVIEHVPDIWSWMKELRRIVKPSGLIIIVTPTSWPFHEEPVDAWRIYPEAMKSLAAQVHLDVVEVLRECLETELLTAFKHLRFIEGRTCFYATGMRGLKKISWYNGMIRNLPVLRHLMISTETAWDLIAVLRKPEG